MYLIFLKLYIALAINIITLVMDEAFYMNLWCINRFVLHNPSYNWFNLKSKFEFRWICWFLLSRVVFTPFIYESFKFIKLLMGDQALGPFLWWSRCLDLKCNHHLCWSLEYYWKRMDKYSYLSPMAKSLIEK